MKKILLILILLFTLFSCRPYDYEKPVYVVEITNPFPGVLVEGNSIIILENISPQLIIEINYNINGKNYTIIDDIVPKQIVILLRDYDEDIICTITEVVFY